MFHRIGYRLLIFIGLIALFPMLQAQGRAPSATTITVTDDILVSDVKRIGINIGSRNRWGAGQFLKNLIDNPGFEAGVYGSVAHVAAGSSGIRIEQDFWDTTWNNDQFNIGQPVGFWDGADYEIVYGPAKGRSGTVSSFTHENNHYVFNLDQSGTAPEQWDVMFVRKTWDGLAATGDWAMPDPSSRPGSPGVQSIHLAHTGESWRASYSFYMDSAWRDGDRTSGKLFIVQGNWHVEFWARGANAGDELRVRFFREGEADFFDETISLSTAWEKYEFDTFVPADTDPLGPYGLGDYHPILGFSLIVPNAGDEVWLDDVALYSTDHTNPTVFTDTFVDRLKELRPGILRNWSNQFGSTLDVQLAEPWARQTQGYRPHNRIPGSYSYSLHEFLALCQEVGAEPWYVIPPTFSPEDMHNLIEYLASPANSGLPYADRRAALGQERPWTLVFPTIHLEFGNELWGAASGSDPFWGASLLGGIRLGQIAHDRFATLKSHPDYDPARVNLIIGGQAGYPGRQGEIDNNSTEHDSIALAPYFGELETYASTEEIFYPLFARPIDDVDTGRVRQSQDELDTVGQGTELAVYELNFHTTGGDSPLDTRNDFVTGQGGALSLPLHHLLYLRELSIKNQTAFSSLQFAFRMANGEYVHLWGMLRDLEATGRKRPTWLGVELINKAIRGDMITTIQSGENPGWQQAPINGVSTTTDVNYIQPFAFREGPLYTIVLFNLNLTDTLTVDVKMPFINNPPPTRYQIAPASIHADNENSEAVFIESWLMGGSSNPFSLDLPPHSLTVVTWPSAFNLYLPTLQSN
jgi:hypothetical protein